MIHLLSITVSELLGVDITKPKYFTSVKYFTRKDPLGGNLLLLSTGTFRLLDERYWTPVVTETRVS